MAALRIFSYLPNPRLWKATIAARLCGVEVEVRGAKPSELPDWLWDFDAKPTAEVAPDILARAERTGRIGFKDRTLYKSEAFLAAHPFATVPAAFSPDGSIGIFESNSIMRAVARLGAEHFPIYGEGPYEAARVDSFLDVGLVFARDTQTYLLALRGDEPLGEIHARAAAAFDIYLTGIEQALAPDRHFLVGDDVTLADICFAAELCLLHNELPRRKELQAQGLKPLLAEDFAQVYPRASAYFTRLVQRPAFAAEIGSYLEKLRTLAAG